MIMAGGRGERLRGLTEHRCKPATPFGGNPSTILLWNGQLGQVPGYLCAGSSGEVPALLAQGLWAWETGAPWQVSKVQPLRGTSQVARYLEGVRWAWEQAQAADAQGL